MTPELPNILISAKDLYLKAGRHDLVEAVSLEVSEGEIVSVIGPNGAGKTSLLKLLLGLYKPDRGSIRRRLGLRVGYLPQKTSIDPVLPLSVARMMTLTESFSRKEVETALAETGVLSLIDEPVQTLSGGEFQRMMLARALLREPELLVLDEPAQGVDHLGEAELYGLNTSGFLGWKREAVWRFTVTTMTTFMVFPEMLKPRNLSRPLEFSR